MCRCDAASARRLWLVPDEWFSRVEAGRAALVQQLRLKMFFCMALPYSFSLSLTTVQEMKQTCYVPGKISDSRHATSCTCADKFPLVLASWFVTFKISVPAVNACLSLASRCSAEAQRAPRSRETLRSLMKFKVLCSEWFYWKKLYCYSVTSCSGTLSARRLKRMSELY